MSNFNDFWKVYKQREYGILLLIKSVQTEKEIDITNYTLP